MSFFQQHPRIFAVTPCSKGFGYAVFEGIDTFIDWGLKEARGNKNQVCLTKVSRLIRELHPSVLILEDASAEGSRRAMRIRKLTKQLVLLGRQSGVRVKLFTRKELQHILLGGVAGTKYEIAKAVAARFSDETGLELPPKRRTGDDEDSRMEIFHAIALIVAYRRVRTRTVGRL